MMFSVRAGSQKKVQSLWTDPTYSNYSGQGVRGTTRLANLLPFALDYFKP
jgi:hypothetical protein